MLYLPVHPRSDTLFDRLPGLLLNLVRIAVQFMPRGAAHHLAAVQNRILGTSRALQHRLAWLLAGHLPTTRKPGGKPRAPGTARHHPSMLPLAHGWLGHLLGPVAIAYAGYLEQALAEPEAQALLAKDPRLALILRPVRRMFGVLPRATRKPRALREPAPPVVHRSIDPPRLDRQGNPKRPWWQPPRRRREPSPPGAERPG